MREIIRAAGLREPDVVQYGHGEIELVWREEKLVVVVGEIPHDADEAEVFRTGPDWLDLEETAEPDPDEPDPDDESPDPDADDDLPF